MMGYRPRKAGLETHSTKLEYLREEVNLIDRDDQDGFEEAVERDPRLFHVFPSIFNLRRVTLFASIFKQRGQIRKQGPIHRGWELRRRVDKLKLKKEKELLENAQAGAINTARGIIGLARPAIDIFPEEVWRIILKKLTDGPDRHACAKACVLFRKILDPAAAKSILFEIFPDLHKYLRDDGDASCIEVCRAAAASQFLKDIPFRPHNNPTETGNDAFRIGYLVRSSTGLITEFSIIGNGLVEGDVTCILVNNTMEEWRMCYMYRHYERVYKSKDDIWERCHDSCIELDIVVNSRISCGRVKTFLQSYGEHIRDLTVDFVWRGRDPTELAKLLTVDQVRYLPNLRKLCLRLMSLAFHNGYKNVVVNSPLIQGSQLETIQIDGGVLVDCDDYPWCEDITILDPMGKLLLMNYHSQLGRLDLSSQFWEGVSCLRWPSLTELHVAGEYYLDTDSIVHASIPNLRRLGLSMVRCISGDLGQEILEAISKLCATTQLNTIRLSFVEERFESWGSLSLPPTLKTLEVEHRNCSSKKSKERTCYSFLTNFPSLENLIVFPDSSDYSRFGQQSGGNEFEMVEVHKYVYDGDMYKSNIWELLPRLKVFTFHEDIYTRKGFRRSDGLGEEEPEYFELITDSIIILFRQK